MHNGQAGDLISADIIEVDLNDDPDFEALSYTWTLASEIKAKPKAIEMRPILINGRMLRIRMNLYHALLAERNLQIPPLWADQICMNQEDDVEKVAQLAIMERIYSSASRVRIWLGDGSSKTESGQWAIEELVAQPRDFSDPVLTRMKSDDSSKSRSTVGRRFKKTTDWAAASGKLVMQQARYEAAADALQNHWYSRAWTLQEFLLAKEVIFLVGDHYINHESLATAASLILEWIEHDIYGLWFYDHTTKDRYNAENLEAIKMMFEERELFRNGKRYTAVEYLAAIRRRQATVLKDKFFAGNALRQDRGSLDLTYGMTTRDIFIGFATQSLWSDIGNMALAHVGSLRPEVEGLPSWVPDLSNPLRPVPLRSCGGSTFPVPITVQGVPYAFDHDRLTVQASQWSTVKATGESSWPWTRYIYEDYDAKDQGHMRRGGSRANEKFGLMFALLNELGQIYHPTNERTLDVLWKTLIGGLSSKEDEAEWRQRFYVWFVHNLCLMRETMAIEMNPTMTWKLSGYGKRTWMVPLISERSAMEQRLAQFLEVHDHVSDNPASQPLRSLIAETQNKRWGGKSVEDFVKSSWDISYHSQAMDVPLEQISAFRYRFERGYEGRRILVTENEFVGSSVEDVRLGDALFLVGGMDTPCVLRPVAGKAGIFTFVGEAYVHGIARAIETGQMGMEFGTISII